MMMRHEQYEGARIALMTLLHNDDDLVMDISDLDPTDRLFLTMECCAVIMEHTLCMIARHHNKNALVGLEMLYKTMRDRITTQCHSVQ